LFGDAPRARRIEARLRGSPGVAFARASERTGRVLAGVGSARGAAEVRAALAAEADPIGPEPPSLRRAVRAASSTVRRAARFVRAVARDGDEAVVPDEQAPPKPPYHALPRREIVRLLDVDPAFGLDDAQGGERLLLHGPNVLAGMEPRSAAVILAGQVLTVPTAILAAAAGASALLGDLLEAAAIGGVVGTNVAIGYFTERRAEELVRAWGEIRAERARVLRRGREAVIRAADVVPGDVLVLRGGEAIAADARVISADGLSMDESTLTGESEPVDKDPAAVPPETPLADRTSMVYAGTVVAAGEGRALVTATGEETELGAVRRALGAARERAAPLERQLDALGKRLAWLSLGSAGLVVGLGTLGGRPLREAAKGAVALGIAAIPEGIPTAGTTALALASRKLKERGIVIRRLVAAETLGAVSAVCADKTGTLTLNRMRVEEIFLPGEGEAVVRWPEGGAQDAAADPGAGRPPDPGLVRRADGAPVDGRAVRDLARVAALNADVEIGDDGAVKRGSGTERALVELAIAVGFPVPAQRRRARRVREERRSADRPFMITVHDDPELGRIELLKGAPEQVVELCDAGDPDRVLRENEAMASRGLRVLACAWRRKEIHDGGKYVFLGLVGLRDPPRPGVGGAIQALGRAGIRTYMLTGDQQRTAEAVAASLGIDPDAVYSRVTPDAKVDVVQDLQRRGHVVAMTGDGVNDAPALETADVGVAMGQRGTDIARAVADVVLARDDLPAIVEAVAEGRRLYDNVRRAIDYLVATNSSEVMVMLAGALAARSPLTPLQLLWLNMLTDVVPALALAVEPADPRAMDRPPRDPNAALFGPPDYRRLGRSAAGMAAASLAGWVYGAARGAPSAAAFTSLVTAQLVHTCACRARGAGPNPALARALAGSVAIQVLAYAAPGLRGALGLGGATPADVAVAAIIGALPGAANLARAARGVHRRDEVVIERPRRSTAAAADRGEELVR
jgi:Ca2+-transporting ATPase